MVNDLKSVCESFCSVMKLPEDALTILEEFWAREYESDYWRFIKIEKHQKVRLPEPKELAAISSI
jgi:hypothetical protein